MQNEKFKQMLAPGRTRMDIWAKLQFENQNFILFLVLFNFESCSEILLFEF